MKRLALLGGIALALTACSNPAPTPSTPPGALYDGPLKFIGHIADYNASRDGSSVSVGTSADTPPVTGAISATGDFTVTVPVPTSLVPLQNLGTCSNGAPLQRSVTASPSTALGRPVLVTLTSSGTALSLQNHNTAALKIGLFYYADRPATLTGTVVCNEKVGNQSTTVFNLNFARGWNFIAITSSVSSGNLTITWNSAPLDTSLDFYVNP